MLIQNHVTNINGFMGQTTGYNKKYLKNHILILAEDLYSEQVKYIHGNVGKGTFTFLGGHDPEDYKHYVGDPPTDLSLHKNSPGYRLILNNVLFPAARKKKKKTKLDALSYLSKPFFQIKVVNHKNIIATINCKNNNFISIPNIKKREGTEEIIAIGKIVNNVFLKKFLYIESGLLEYLVNSPASHPAYEKFLNQKTREAIINSNE